MTDPTADAAKLLPCPFCGSSHAALNDDKDRWKQVICSGCGAHGTEFPYDAEKAIAAWNSRAPAPREDGWRPIKTQPPTKADGLFLVFVPSCIMGCALVENGKIVWPREGESEQAHGVTHWRPLPAPPSAREG